MFLKVKRRVCERFYFFNISMEFVKQDDAQKYTLEVVQGQIIIENG